MDLGVGEFMKTNIYSMYHDFISINRIFSSVLYS